jgi:hypothetical protein
MDGKNADIVGSETSNSKCTAEGSNVGVCTFRTLHMHAMGGKVFFLLATCLSLEVSDTARNEIGIHKFALASAEIQFLFQLLLLESKPVSNLFSAEGDLAGTVANIKDRRWGRQQNELMKRQVFISTSGTGWTGDTVILRRRRLG